MNSIQSEFFEDDSFEGRRRRDEGIERIIANNEQWMDVAILCLHKLPSGWHGLPEKWRFAIIKAIGEPTDPHAWGALTREAIKRGLVRRTGRRFKMQAARSNYRETDEYERP